MQYLIQPTAQSAINNHLLLCPSYMFRPVQGRHQGVKYKDIQVQQILLKICMCVYARVCVELKCSVVN